MPIDTQIQYKKERIARIIVNKTGPGGCYYVGTAFPIRDTGRYLTCFHVVFENKKLENIKSEASFAGLAGANDHEKLWSYHRANISGMQLQLSNKSFVNVELHDFSEQYDAAVVSITGNSRYSLELDTESPISIGDEIFFCGYQYAVGIEARDFPFTVNSGFVSTIVNTQVCGNKYEHLQINSVNLGGNSGAPLFLSNSNVVIGIINGNMRWGYNNFGFVNNNQTSKGEFYVPLSIAYATSLSLLARETNLLN